MNYHKSNKSIIITCIEKYGKYYILYYAFSVYLLFAQFKTITIL